MNNMNLSIVTGLVELYIIRGVLQTLEHRRAGLALRLHLQGRVREDGSQQSHRDAVRFLRLCDIPRVHHRVLAALLLPGATSAFRWCRPLPRPVRSEQQ